MKSITINGSKRESVGKKATKALRNAGQIPCVLYGVEGDPLHFAAEEISFKDLVYTPDVHTVKIKLKDGNSFDAILQDIQFHPVTDAILHVDFYQIFDDKPISMEIPVHTEGVARGVKNGGVLRYNLRRLKVRGLPGDLPDFIIANVSKLKIGQKLYVTELASDDFKIQHPENTVICQVRTSRNIVEIEDEDDDEVAADEVPATEVDDEAAVISGQDPKKEE